MLLYADDGFSYPVVEELRRLGHDVLTVPEDGQRSASDARVLARGLDSLWTDRSRSLPAAY